MNEEIIKGYLLEYLNKKNIKVKKSGTVTMVECPYCHKAPMSATIPPRCNFVSCFACGNQKKTIIDLVREIDKVEGDNDTVIHYIKELLNLDIVTKKDKEQTDEVLKFYQDCGFDLVPVAKDKKNPIENDWTNKTHKTIEEWQRWLGDGINIGIKTGKISNLTIIDVDVKPVPKEILALVGDTFALETSKGFQYYYKYVSELPKTRINDLKIDIENDGGQCVAYPSAVDGVKRKINNFKPVIEMPKELLAYIKTKVTVPLKSFSEKLKEDIQTENFNLNLLEEGERNASLMKLGGLLRKELNVNQTERVLSILNRHICSNPITPKELSAMVKSLSKYTAFDEQELAHRVITYLKDVEESNRTEICMAIMGTNRGEEKMRIDKVLNYLVREQYILKKGSRYCIIKKLEWKEGLIDIGIPVNFKVPYFYDVGTFNYEDLILIGARNKVGKTHISINIIKRLVEQGVTPHLINLEKGGRFGKVAIRLGLKEGDFKYAFCADPSQIEIEKNAVTVIDWLLIENKAETDIVMRHFVEQLDKQGGLLIIFQQLKEDNTWFAPNMAKQFPALALRYLYDDENDGRYGHFHIDAIREPSGQLRNFKNWDIPCSYDPETKLFMRVDELGSATVKEQTTEPKSEDVHIDNQEISN
jgi:hypothetical protein